MPGRDGEGLAEGRRPKKRFSRLPGGLRGGYRFHPPETGWFRVFQRKARKALPIASTIVPVHCTVCMYLYSLQYRCHLCYFSISKWQTQQLVQHTIWVRERRLHRVQRGKHVAECAQCSLRVLRNAGVKRRRTDTLTSRRMCGMARRGGIEATTFRCTSTRAPTLHLSRNHLCLRLRIR